MAIQNAGILRIPTAVDARAWLAKASQDLRRVDLLLAAEPPDPE
jgi:hypothetical protein